MALSKIPSDLQLTESDGYLLALIFELMIFPLNLVLVPIAYLHEWLHQSSS